jgi:Protein of unknown function (DUF3277)
MGSNVVRTYNPERVVVNVNGHNVTGFADGTFVAIAQVSDGITTQVGSDGEIARAINTDRRCNVTITLQQTSQSNDFLSNLHEVDMLTCGSKAGPIMVQDLCGTTLFAAASSWITKMPDTEFGKEISTRAWALQTGAPSTFRVGSNVANG